MSQTSWLLIHFKLFKTILWLDLSLITHHNCQDFKAVSSYLITPGDKRLADSEICSPYLDDFWAKWESPLRAVAP